MATCSVLVVEDRDDIRAFLAATVAARCDVAAVSTGAAAREALARAVYHVVILNLALPDADAVALAEEARRRGCAVIAIPHQAAQFAKAAREGFYVLVRPFDRRRLLELLDRVARERVGAE